MTWPPKQDFDHSRNRSDESLTLETSALESLYDGQITVSTLLIKIKYTITTGGRETLALFVCLFVYLFTCFVLFCFVISEKKNLSPETTTHETPTSFLMKFEVCGG